MTTTMTKATLIADHKVMRKTTGHFDLFVSLMHAAAAAGFTDEDLDEMERAVYSNDPTING